VAFVHKALARELLPPRAAPLLNFKRDKWGLYVFSQSKLTSLGGHYRVRNNAVRMVRGADAGRGSPSRSLGRFGNQQLRRLWPVGPGIDCKADCSGTACTFFTSSFTGTGKSDPGGPFTATGTSTAFFGLNGSALTSNGAVNPDGTSRGL
jgi:hypothetical protein